ncbi:glycosyltransferase family 2 protein [Pedobacter gandavensis]|uniref:glycosyltransferase family 2 protein n=1 Tax=Pedobacter TaxID=84567 RepID=UPI001C992182|nr:MULTISPECIES: glycosyltransferase family 2 protein [Pedobacter]WGQ11077.1 glycosyltransferase family 2 protein [Pedobacter gandavensis]
MSYNPLVSIVIPTFNRADKLSDAIESALNQTYKNVQVIVIDDGSTDDTAELVKKYPDVEYHWQKNGGQAAARNKGLKNAKGPILASLDSDDIWYPNFLERCVEKLESDHLDFVFANWDQDVKVGDSWDFLSGDPFLKPYHQHLKNHWSDLGNKELRDLFLKACPSPSSAVVIRKSSIVSGWDEQINIGDDWCMYLEMILTKKCKAAYTLDRLWRKRVDEINIFDGRKWSEILEFLYIADLKIKIDKFKHLLHKDELKILQRRYMASLVELSKHNLIREFNIPHSFRLLKRSFAIDIPFTLRTIPNVMMKGLGSKVKSLTEKFNKKI